MTPEDPDDLPEALARVVLLAQQTEIAARRFFRVGARHAARAYRFGRRLAREREQRRRADLRRKWRHELYLSEYEGPLWMENSIGAPETRRDLECEYASRRDNVQAHRRNRNHIRAHGALRTLREMRAAVEREQAADLDRMRARVAAWRAEQEAKP